MGWQLVEYGALGVWLAWCLAYDGMFACYHDLDLDWNELLALAGNPGLKSARYIVGVLASVNTILHYSDIPMQKKNDSTAMRRKQRIANSVND